MDTETTLAAIGPSRRTMLSGMLATAAGAAVVARAGSASAEPVPASIPGIPAGAILAQSPGRRSRVGISVADGLSWAVAYDQRTIIEPSPLGLMLGSGAALGPDARIRQVSRRQNDSTWRPLYGRQAAITDAYEEVRVELIDPSSGAEFAVVARAYDEGVALRYELTGSGDVDLSGEATSFALPEGAVVYSARDEDPFLRVTPGQIPQSGTSHTDSGALTDQPLALGYPDGAAACICESARAHYPRMMLSADAADPAVLRTHLMQYAGRGGSAPAAPTFTVTAPFSTPWRVIVAGATAAELVDHADLVTTLATPSTLGDTSWIRPGKAIRATTLTTAKGLAYIDFAAMRGLRYIEFDAGWYGPEGSSSSDPTKPIAGLDLTQVISYGQAKDIGVILYVNQIALTDPAGLFALYEQWSVSGLKLGFILEGTQAQTDWIVSVAEQAAAHHLLLNLHDDLRPSGQERTSPNWITLEGVRGNEHFPTATHNVTLPFGRNIGGPMDYTICLAQGRNQTTNVHQMAMAAVYYAPLAWLYWYDDPTKYATGSWPELPWFDAIPTSWDESRTLTGEIAQYIVVARRSGATWYVGAMTNEQGRVIDLPLDFLGDGSWQATIYADGNTPDNARDTSVLVSQQTVSSQASLRMRLAPAGGQAIVLARA